MVAMATCGTRISMSLCFSKLGDARFLGHLDFARVLERSLRRSGLPVRYTEGFNPRIKLSFADALPVGVASEGEWVTLILDEDLAPEDVRTRLAAALPRVVTIHDLRRGKPPVPEQPVRYLLGIVEGAGSVTDALQELLIRKSCLVEDPRRGTTLDIRLQLVSGEITRDGLLVDLAEVNGRPPRPGPLVQGLCALAREVGNDPPRFGIATRLAPTARRHGDDRWQDAASTHKVVAPGGASSSSTPPNPKRAASPS